MSEENLSEPKLTPAREKADLPLHVDPVVLVAGGSSSVWTVYFRVHCDEFNLMRAQPARCVKILLIHTKRRLYPVTELSETGKK